MPIFFSSERMVFFASPMSIRRIGPTPIVGSDPRKKFRQIDISGTVARSWNTVAIPRSFAARGEPNETFSPSMRISPSSWWWTPERILMNVDFPAPLSPRTQVTSPSFTTAETSFRAITFPKYFETWSISRSGALPFPLPACVAVISVLLPRCVARSC
jgi:hypothetical protein